MAEIEADFAKLKSDAFVAALARRHVPRLLASHAALQARLTEAERDRLRERTQAGAQLDELREERDTLARRLADTSSEFAAFRAAVRGSRDG